MPVQFILFSAQINKVHHLFLSTKDYTGFSSQGGGKLRVFLSAITLWKTRNLAPPWLENPVEYNAFWQPKMLMI